MFNALIVANVGERGRVVRSAIEPRRARTGGTLSGVVGNHGSEEEVCKWQLRGG